mgnify:CR=1 FL=1
MKVIVDFGAGVFGHTNLGGEGFLVEATLGMISGIPCVPQQEIPFALEI